jgi:two-component system response regulator MprA
MAEAAAGCVLVVDDDPDICEVIQTVLELYGYRAISARDGAEALLQLREGVRPCLIILDLMMPRMNGFQFREEQQKDPAFRNIPVVVLSGDGKAEGKAANLGLDGLRKPIELEVLLEVVGRSCHASSGAAS